MEKYILRSKMRGCLIGTAIGDALGMPVEGLNYYQIQKKYGEVNEIMDGRLPAGSYTDDTQLMIGLAESLIEKKEINQEHIAHKFVQIYENYRGYGPVLKQFVQLMELGWEWDKAVQKTHNFFSYLNGSAMRVAPIGVFYYDNPEEVLRAAYQSSDVTHIHELAREGCALQALAISLVIEQKPSSDFDRKTYLRTLQESVSHKVYKEKLKSVKNLLLKEPDIFEVIKILGNGVEAFNSVPTAIYCFLRYLDSFEKSIIYAVNLGGDADTIGAMTGALSGAYHGIEAIPLKWLDKLEDKDYIQSLADKIWVLKTLRNRKTSE